MSDLFRKEALDAAGAVRLGNPIALMPWSWWALTAFFGIFGVSVVVFLATATFPRKETATGILRQSLGEIRVSTPRSGIVTALFVHDGQSVQAGDLLAFVTTEQLFASGEVYDARVLIAIERERNQYEIRLEALNTSEPLQKQALTARVEGLSRQLQELQTNKSASEAQLVLARQSSEAADTLTKQGWFSQEQQRQRRQVLLTTERSMTEIGAQIDSLESQRIDFNLQLVRLPSDVAQTRASILELIEALEEKRAAAAAQNGFALIARAAGTITAVQARIGQPVDPVKPLMAIIPRGSKLEAELYVPSRAIGFVSPGLTVRLLYEAFPYTRFGPGFGTVVDLSTAVLTPEEVSAAIKVPESVYRATVELRNTEIVAYGKPMPLQSGMALKADILLEDRSFLDLLMDPLLAARGRVLGGS
jgi:membrane fusion protein